MTVNMLLYTERLRTVEDHGYLIAIPMHVLANVNGIHVKEGYVTVLVNDITNS